MIKIESLTKEQEIQLIEFREEWRKHALSCERIDKEATKNCISELYKLIGKKPPVFIFCPSLLFAQYQIEYCKNILPLKNNISANLWDNLGVNLSDNLSDNLMENLIDNLGVNLIDNLGENIMDNLRDNLRYDLRDNLRSNLSANLKENLRNSLDTNLRNSLDTNLWENLIDNIDVNLGSNLRDNLRENLIDNLRKNLGVNINENIDDNIEANLGENLGDNISYNLMQNLFYNLMDNLIYNLMDNLGENLGQNLGQNLMSNLRHNIMVNLEENIRKNLRENTWEKIKPPYVSTNLLGSMDAFWIAFYEFPEKFLGVEYKIEDKKILNIWSTLAKSCSWFWCYENYCFVSDRPEKLSFNTQNKLHCEDAPAVKWIDGWEIYYWNGTEVPKQWIIDKNSITKETIIKEKNAEKRRCIREIIGTKQYANLIDIKEIDKDHVNGQDVILYRTKEKDDIINEHIYYVNVTCHSTLREYFLCIPKVAAKNAWSAVAWTFKMNEQEYKPIIET
ncbi:MAG TPA: hypothetical protein PKD00_04975 [Burkholderiales bacterium]|nr:hypothetical protein [Burkholderiales bacterium]